MEPTWCIDKWVLRHARHGTFYVQTLPDGRFNACRVYGSAAPYTVEWFDNAREPFGNVAQAFIACEERMRELDQLALRSVA